MPSLEHSHAIKGRTKYTLLTPEDRGIIKWHRASPGAWLALCLGACPINPLLFLARGGSQSEM
jgi:hypothetical protein